MNRLEHPQPLGAFGFPAGLLLALPDHVLGQPDAASVRPNAGGGPDPTTLYWPFGIAVIDGRFHVADSGNNRVVIWERT